MPLIQTPSRGVQSAFVLKFLTPQQGWPVHLSRSQAAWERGCEPTERLGNGEDMLEPRGVVIHSRTAGVEKDSQIIPAAKEMARLQLRRAQNQYPWAR